VYIQQVPTSGTCKKKPAAHHKTTPSVQHITTTVQHPTWVQTPKQPTVKKPQHPSAKHSQQHPKQQTKVTKPPPHPVPVIPVAASVKQPSAVSAAFDLGFGPTALFAALLAAAALLAVGGGLRHGRRR